MSYYSNLTTYFYHSVYLTSLQVNYFITSPDLFTSEVSYSLGLSFKLISIYHPKSIKPLAFAITVTVT